jgi:hypothetical protein
VVTAGVTLPSTPPVDGSKPLPRKQISHVRIFEYEGRAATGAAFLFKRAAASPTTHSARRSRRGTGHANCRTWGSPRSASRVIARRRLRRCVTASGKGRCRSPAKTRSNRWLWPSFTVPGAPVHVTDATSPPCLHAISPLPLSMYSVALPAGPAGPVSPRSPLSPLSPLGPAGPIGPCGPAGPTSPFAPAAP